jgi:prepilin-type N-terminal cleavage/methylation domain-containing protein
MRAGFSMLEMLIVLAILSALTMIAVQSLEPVAEKSRYESTMQTLEGIKSAIIAVNQNGGTTSISGLAADTSLLPDLNSGPAFFNSLVAGVDIPESASYMLSGGLTAVYGWRGPYLQTTQTTQFLDAWSQPLGVEFRDFAGVPKNSFTELTDQLVISNTGAATTTSRYASVAILGTSLSARELNVNLYGLDAYGNRITLTDANRLPSLPQVFLLGGLDPEGTTPESTKELTAELTNTDPVSTTYQYRILPALPQLLVGTRILTVVTQSATSTNYTAYSPALQVNLLPGSSPTIELLVLRETSTVADAPEEP